MNSSCLQQPAEAKFFVNLDSLLADCRSSNDSSRQALCAVNTMYGALAGVFLPLFLPIGVVGNAMTTAILLRSMPVQSRQNVYLAAIAVSDNGHLLIFGLLFVFLARGLPWATGGAAGWIVVNFSDTACRLHRFGHLWFGLLSASLFLAMALDRTLSLYFPFRFRTVGPKHAWRVCGVVTLATVLLSAPYAFVHHWTTDSGSVRCLLGQHLPLTFRQTFSVFTVLLHYPPTLPILGVIATNVALVYKVVGILRRRRRMLAAGRGERRPCGERVNSSVICVALSVVLAACAAPCAVTTAMWQSMLVSGSYSLLRFRTLVVVAEASQIFLLLNQSVNWVVLCWRSLRFRRHFRRALCSCCCCFCRRLRRRRRRQQMTAMNATDLSTLGQEMQLLA